MDSEEKETEKAVVHCFEKNHGNYGRIRIRKARLADGLAVSEQKIARILKKYELHAKSGRKGTVRKSKPNAEQYIEENLIADKFAVTEPNYLWCSDITELKCAAGKLYLCGIIDVATRRLVGWSMAKHQRQELVQECIRMAVGKILSVLRALSSTATEVVSIPQKEQKNLWRATVFERACHARAPRVTISQSRVSGILLKLRCRISGISISKKQVGSL